ncbi:SDR family oxidoreductase [Streptomyces griseomycini]|uniref:Short-subunit dehydrogenase n=1 Tax=Streptomyces griseomycini TaxID=66895 RepID=A0A7W7PRY4_9ACTN|nr:SDR family oxidoreductase [Streptomyces griseomycini]MBB4899193.1 short-subunit dehydrogenase [Streptomyces griseomycini]GGR20601.1 short-chain dehydrogenase [Streptomyces griseomycini]
MRVARSPLHGRTAVVTGAARGLGEATVRDLAGRGAKVALLGREERTLARVRDSLQGDCECWEVDVTDDRRMARVGADVRARLGPPSIVIANAGVAEGGPFAESDPAVWRRVIEVNLLGSATTARTFMKDLFGTRGYFLQVASLASIGAAPMMSAYCASKAGVESFAHSLRAEVAHRHVGVGIAYINWTDTDMVRDADAHAVLRELRGHMPPPARRVYPAAYVARRLVDAIERRRPTVYVPRWLRSTQLVRAAMPPVVTLLSRRELPRLDAVEPFEATGLLGAGGQADRAARDPGPASG